MVASQPLHPEAALDLTLAVIASSMAPLVLLDGDLVVIGASSSFYGAFQIDPARGSGQEIFALGQGSGTFANCGRC